MTRPLLKPFQVEALSALQRHSHLVCISPTGSGKSRIFQEWLIRHPSQKALLISPLVALARQHHERLTEFGISTCLVSGGDPSRPKEDDRVWILSPESIPFLKQSIQHWKPELLVVDECHAVLEWGREFRPEFTLVPELLSHVTSIKRSLWLTATLSHRDHRDLLSRLPEGTQTLGRLELPPQLRLIAQHSPWPDRDEDLQNLLTLCEGPGIIFAPTRKRVHQISEALKWEGGRFQNQIVSYHAGLSREERRGIETRIALDRSVTVVATSAFGMGMDFQQFNWTIVTQTPWSRLALAQAVGRVGRSDRAGHAWLLWDEEDFQLLRRWKGSPCPHLETELSELLSLLRRGPNLGLNLIQSLQGSGA